MKLDGKTAIVTGAGSGIGKAIALTFAREGAGVVIADIDLESALKTAKEIEALGRAAEPVEVDVANSRQVDQMVEKTIAKFKKIDILVNDAGIWFIVPPEKETEDQANKTLDTNLKGTLLCAKAVGKYMIKQGHGKIINIASTSGHRAAMHLAAYAASKGGVLALTRALAVSWGKYNIHVNSVSPGSTLTEGGAKGASMRGEDYEKHMKDRTRMLPLGRPNKPQDIANAVLFLASTEAENMTGQDIIVDNGGDAMYPSAAMKLLER